MTAATTNRRLLVAVAAVGVVAGLVGIGASIAGTDDERDAGDPTTTTTTPPDAAAPPSSDAAAPPSSEAPATEAPAPPEEEGAAEEDEAAEEAAEARLEAEAAVSRTRAEGIALGQVAGTIDRARISDETGTPVWEVRVEGADGDVDVLVDATTGQVLEVDD